MNKIIEAGKNIIEGWWSEEDQESEFYKGDNLGAEKAFKDTIASKVGDALETKRKEVANTFVKSTVTQDEGDGEEV